MDIGDAISFLIEHKWWIAVVAPLVIVILVVKIRS